MRYGVVELNYESGSLSILKKKSQLVRHYIGTDISDCFPLGKQSTTIKCTLLITSEEDKILVEQLLHTSVERELHFDTYYYKRVVTGDDFTAKPFVDGLCTIPVEFIALDPVPYGEITGEVLY